MALKSAVKSSAALQHREIHSCSTGLWIICCNNIFCSCSKAINAFSYTFIRLFPTHFEIFNLLVNNVPKINILIKTHFFLLQFGTSFVIDRVDILILYGQWHDISHLLFIMSTFSKTNGEFSTKFNISEGK